MKSGDKDCSLSRATCTRSSAKKRSTTRSISTTPASRRSSRAPSSSARTRIEQFKAGGRQDLVDKEEAELKFLRRYMPEQMSEDEVRKIVDWAVTEAKASSSKDMGNVMKLLMPKVQGKADGKLVNQLVKETTAADPAIRSQAYSRRFTREARSRSRPIFSARSSACARARLYRRTNRRDRSVSRRRSGLALVPGQDPARGDHVRTGGSRYVYFIYGMYEMLNFVTEKEGEAGAVADPRDRAARPAKS